MTSIFPPFNRRTSFRKQPYFFEAGRGVNSKGLAGPIPALSLTFTSGVLDPRITFSRPSLATYFDSTGKLTYAPNNLLLRSEQFDNAYWTKTNLNTTGTPAWVDVAVAPDGTQTADKLIEDTAASTTHFVRSSGVSTIVAGGVIIFSAYIKAGERNWVFLANASYGNFAYFNVATGAIGTSSNCTPSISAVGNGWYRCSILMATSPGTQQFDIRLATSNGVIVYTGDGTSGLFVWGTQLEHVTYQTTPSTYVPTTASAYYGPRFEYDPVTLVPRGLLIEEARTNLILQSENFGSASWTPLRLTVSTPSITAPDGTSPTDQLLDTAVAGTHVVIQTISKAASSLTYTTSVFLKANVRTLGELRLSDQSGNGVRNTFNLSNGTIGSPSTFGTGFTAGQSSITPVGSDWYRVTMTATTNTATTLGMEIYIADASGNTSYTGNGSGFYAWGAQLELGAFATSYLPTGASTAARSADVVSMTGTNFSSWFSATQGTFVVQADIIAANAAKSATLVGAPTSSYLPLYLTAAAAPLGRTWDGTNIATTANPASTGGAFKITNAYRSDGLAVCLNAGTVASNSYNGAFSSMTSVYFGSGNTGTDLFLNGHIASIQFYTSRLSNDQLQALTQPSLEASMFLTFDTSSDSFVDASWGP